MPNAILPSVACRLELSRSAEYSHANTFEASTAHSPAAALSASLPVSPMAIARMTTNITAYRISESMIDAPTRRQKPPYTLTALASAAAPIAGETGATLGSVAGAATVDASPPTGATPRSLSRVPQLAQYRLAS